MKKEKEENLTEERLEESSGQESAKEKHDKHDFEETKKEIELLKDYNMELENKLLYSQAELVNYRKRKDEETSTLLKYSNQEIILELLVILDNFERAMKASEKNPELSNFISGFEMIYNHLNETLKKYGVTEIEALGTIFDPNCHEAMLTGSESEKEDEEVLEVLMKGYRLKDRVIRPTVVKVNQLS